MSFLPNWTILNGRRKHSKSFLYESLSHVSGLWSKSSVTKQISRLAVGAFDEKLSRAIMQQEHLSKWKSAKTFLECLCKRVVYRSYVIQSAGEMGPPGSDTVWFTKSKQVLFVFGSTDRPIFSKMQEKFLAVRLICLFLSTPYFVKTIKLQLEVYNKAENINTYLL